MLGRFRRAVGHGRRHGVGRTVRYARYQAVNSYYDLRLGVHTGGMVTHGSLGIDRPDAIHYVPIGYRALLGALELLPDPRGRTLLELGAGKGRALVAAALLPFERVIGIELAEQLVAAAEANVASMRGRRARLVEIHQADATLFRVPDDVDVIYLFNPFVGCDLSRVVENIRSSLERRPRELHILYFNDGVFEKRVAGETWLVKTYAAQCYPDISFGYYRSSGYGGSPSPDAVLASSGGANPDG